MSGARRRTARGAAVATAVLLGGMIPGAQASSGLQEVDLELAYTCDLPEGGPPKGDLPEGGPPEGGLPVKVGVTAKLPASARPGQAIQPEDVVLEATLPEGAIPASTGSPVASVSAETRLGIDVSQEGRRARAEWVGTTSGSVPVPAEGGLPLTTTGTVPYVKPGASGDLAFDAGALSVELALKTADGMPAEPPGLSLGCTLDPDQETGLAKLEIGDGDGDGEGASAPPASPSSGKRPARDGSVPEVGTRAERTDRPDAPPCVGDVGNDLNLNAYVTGYANVTKLKGASRIPLACTQIEQGPTRVDLSEPGFTHIYQDSTALLDYEGKPQLPPVSSTFLTFGFMPTTATLEMTQIPAGVDADGTPDYNVSSHLVVDWTDFSNTGTTTINLELMLRLRDVEVNGVPLDVGDNCRTSKPFPLTLVGRMTAKDGVTTGYTLVTGGVLEGSVTLPSFSGCGAGEDLDSLFTASLSGVPGYVKQVQGAPCAAAQHVPGTENSVCTDAYEPIDVPVAIR
ncbi:DUF6801 domain-containing protein [Streptomyces sp. NPDC059166]|uniref:DUF6801 domain-containing protein n=1 Tax=Streptomyces sp. NPDC059166 TaxID=3346752 RepID=UPI0036981335